jgi:hypothetical protein
MTQRTQWFDPNWQPPVHIGLYEYIFDGDEASLFMAHWDGVWFSVAEGTDFYGALIAQEPNDRWRGLA